MLTRLAGLMAEHEDDLAALMVLEQGKPLAEARTEVACGVLLRVVRRDEARRRPRRPVPLAHKRVWSRASPWAPRGSRRELPVRDGHPQVGARAGSGAPWC